MNNFKERANTFHEKANILQGGLNNIAGSAFQGHNSGTINFCQDIAGGFSEKLRQCIQALVSSASDPQDDRQSLLVERHQFTDEICQWILEDETFRQWHGDDLPEHPLIWLCDKPGVGKTALALFISRQLEIIYAGRKDCWILYYFCDGQDERRNSPIAILRGLMYLLFLKSGEDEGLARIIYKEYQYHQNNLFEQHSLGKLWKIFQAMVQASGKSKIFCIIDGVDQCQEKTLGTFLRMLSEYFTPLDHHRRLSTNAGSQNSPALPPLSSLDLPETTVLRTIVLARENPRCIEEVLAPFPRLKVEAELKGFINANVDRVSASCFGDKTPNIQTVDMITQALSTGVDQGYLWVSLATEKLMSMKQSQVKKYITKLPSTVEDMYYQTLYDIPTRQRPHAATLLKWVALAVRPLSILELTKAVKYSTKTNYTQRSLGKVLALCSGLVRQSDARITLADRSVRDFLSGAQSRLRFSKDLQEFVFDESNGHSHIANTCITYLQDSGTLKKSRRVRIKEGQKLKPEEEAFLLRHPFLEYAVVNWPSHAQKGNLNETCYDAPFFKTDSVRRRLWWESYWISLRQCFAWKWTAPGDFTLLHLAAFFNIVPLARYVEQKGHLRKMLCAEDHQGMRPINWATEKCHQEMVQYLLGHGAFDDKALRQAARTGETTIIAMLLENREKIWRSPELVSASQSPALFSNPFSSMKKAALGTLSDVAKKWEQTDEEETMSPSSHIKGYGESKSETPLHIAATYGHSEAVDAFLDAGEEIDKRTDGGWTALHNAAWFGRVAVVNRLISAKADPIALTNEKLTPLHCAIKNSQLEVVQTLLAKKDVVDIEARDQYSMRPLHMACKSGNIAVIELLLKHGADIESVMPPGWTPLLWACSAGQYNVAELLLNRGADADYKWIRYSTEAGRKIEIGAISLAKTYRHEGLARLVKNFGAADADQMASEDAQALLPAEKDKEEYNVPHVPAVVVVAEEEEPGASVDEEESAGDVDSDGESDAGNDVDDEISGSRHPSTSIAAACTERPEQGVVPLHGLGIYEADSTENRPTSTTKALASRGTSVDEHAQDSIATTHGDVPVRNGVSPQPETRAQSCSSPSIQEKTPTETAKDVSKSRWSSGTSRAFGSFGSRLSSFSPNLALSRHASEDSSLSPRSEQQSPELVVGSDEPEEAIVKERSQSEAGLLGRLSPRKRVTRRPVTTEEDRAESRTARDTPMTSPTPEVAAYGPVPATDNDNDLESVIVTPPAESTPRYGRFDRRSLFSGRSETSRSASRGASPDLTQAAQPEDARRHVSPSPVRGSQEVTSAAEKSRKESSDQGSGARDGPVQGSGSITRGFDVKWGLGRKK
ncbi:hypothetical protein B9Z65_5960 [Elsinoe australis]|uniref:Uncharacterized protein n=1 Tax=Elsinoe australis TaxID=40998 RepID=A0A2P7YJN4_9PEZI|nr:hypothetical protein B9Z65_5960 [Elsinoe australis]